MKDIESAILRPNIDIKHLIVLLILIVWQHVYKTISQLIAEQTSYRFLIILAAKLKVYDTFYCKFFSEYCIQLPLIVSSIQFL